MMCTFLPFLYMQYKLYTTDIQVKNKHFEEHKYFMLFNRSCDSNSS